MPDSKNLNWLKDLDVSPDEAASETPLSPDQPAANDEDGWQQYRRWISKAPAPASRRSGIDPSLYSWRNYRNWTEEVKRSWPEKEDD